MAVGDVEFKDNRFATLRCIVCRDPKSRLVPSDEEHPPTSVDCSVCKHTFWSQTKVLEIMPPDAIHAGWSQDVYDNDWMADIYEKWTRSIGTFLLAGLRYKDEYDYLRQHLHAAYDTPILDLCCATGPHSRVLAQEYGAGRVMGLDLSPNMLQKGARLAEEQQLNDILWIRGNALKLPFGNETLGAINCFGAVHLFPDPAAGLRESGRVLIPGGTYTAFVAVEHSNFVMRRLQLLGSPLFGVKTFNRKTLEGWLQDAGMKLSDYSVFGPAAMFTAIRLAT